MVAVYCSLGLGLREPGDIQLLGAFLGADKDGVGSVGTNRGFPDSIRAVEEGEDVPGPFAAGDR
jgi:hypothetical protein